VLKTFTNIRGYTVQYPSSWRREGIQDLFWIWNFPASRAVRGEILPDGGAGIKILVPSQAVHNLKHNPSNMEEWVAVGTGTNTVVGKRAFELDDGQRRLAVIEVESLCCVSPPYQVSVDWFFEVGDRKFVASLFYWQSDPNADKLREVLRQVVLSLKVTK
jgi:hypothetical protein